MPLIKKNAPSLNIYLTSVCGHQCEFCFDSSSIDKREFDRSDFSLVLHKIRQECSNISFIGGEPLAHPEFCWFLNHAIDQGFKVNVFTAAEVIPDVVFQTMLFAPIGSFHITLNSSAKGFNQWEAWSPLNHLVNLGVTLVHDTEPLFLAAEQTLRWSFRPHLRVGIAQPAIDGTNEWTPTEEFQVMGSKITRAAIELKTKGIEIGLDCGFTRCMFSDEDMEYLEAANTAYCFSCEPIPDLAPKGIAWPCLPLASVFSTSISDVDCLKDLVTRLQTDISAGLNHTLYEKCPDCIHYLNHLCAGGCKSRIRLKQTQTAKPAFTPYK